MKKEVFCREETILYKIKVIDKLVIRNLMSNENFIKNSVPSRSQIEIINYMLSHQDEDVYQKDLEKVLKLRRATISGVLSTMEKKRIH